MYFVCNSTHSSLVHSAVVFCFTISKMSLSCNGDGMSFSRINYGKKESLSYPQSTNLILSACPLPVYMPYLLFVHVFNTLIPVAFCLSLSLPAYQLVCLSSLYSTCLTPCLRDLLLLFVWLAALLNVCLNPYWSQLLKLKIHSMCYIKWTKAE